MSLKIPYPIQSTRRAPVRGTHAVRAVIVTAASFGIAWAITWIACELYRIIS